VQIVVPARNEQESIAACLESLAAQQGIEFQITVVDDGSTDQTSAIAKRFPKVRVIAATEPGQGVSGKCNALIIGARSAKAKWLLFTDADTVHSPGSLAAAVREAEESNLDLLSWSPEQEASTFSEKALMPVVFAELQRVYPPEQVNDPANDMAAANGQYLLVRREAYELRGGHRAVADKILEDVELARWFKRTGAKIRFGSGIGMVKTRMYRNLSGMVEGWTKNLVLLFPGPLKLALVRLLEFVLVMGCMAAGAALAGWHHQGGLLLLLCGGAAYTRFLLRIRKAHFAWQASLAAMIGLPMFCWLLLRSYLHWNVRGSVAWKGRRYLNSEPPAKIDSSIVEETFTL
jgi:glycosyltransferase involved in cell wall biosynthesis